jgi:peptidoglycan/LPS O-acetylase OafA/YrhL
MEVRSKFRYDINALRSIAVLGVVLFHYKVPFFEGGFTGVDIFFVISGYLMTNIILTSLDNSKFNLIGFYNRRGLRILPALLFVILSVVLISFFIYLPADFQQVSKNAAASVLFYSNILYSQIAYFDVSSDNNIFLHTWSLSVEWQFYLILPVLLMVLHKIFKSSRKKILFFLLSCTILIFCLSCVISHYSPEKAFYFLPTRSWEMLAGSIAFLVEDKISNKIRRFTALIGYITLAICLTCLSETMLWPGLYTLIPVLGTFLIIVSNYDFAILRSSGIEMTGKISYSLYLWHWPVIVIANYRGIQLDAISILCYIIISFVLSYFTYKYIENYKNVTTKHVVLATLTLAAISYVLTYNNINKYLFTKETLEIANYKKNHSKEQSRQFSDGVCFSFTTSSGKFNGFNKEKCLYIDENKRNYILLGDSHAAHISQSVKEIIEDENIHIMQASVSGCVAVYKPHGLEYCTQLINFMYTDFIPKNAENIDGIILSSNWENELKNKDLISDIEGTIRYLEKLHIPVILLGQNETFIIPYPSIAAREHELNKSVSDKFITASSKETNALLLKKFKSNYINIFNNGTYKKLSDSNIPYMVDQNHYTKYGADCVVREILNKPQLKAFFKL